MYAVLSGLIWAKICGIKIKKCAVMNDALGTPYGSHPTAAGRSLFKRLPCRRFQNIENYDGTR
jgi:hypothetical protein